MRWERLGRGCHLWDGSCWFLSEAQAKGKGAREEHATARCKLMLFAMSRDNFDCNTTPFWDDHSELNLSAAETLIDQVGVPSELRCPTSNSSFP